MAHIKPSVVCSVSDDGPGLNEEDKAKLFQRGIKLSSVPTGGESSSGYGLAVAKELIDKLGGDLWCESTLGAGACFSFRLPAYQEGQESTITGAQEAADMFPNGRAERGIQPYD